MIEAKRTVDAAADLLRRRILEGVYAAGDRLPAERKLSEELGISRLTLRAALARLESERLVRPRQGAGVTVLDWRTEADAGLLPHLLAHGNVDELFPSFLELRRAIASEATAAAAVRASDAELDALEAFATELMSAEGEALLEGNLGFSRRVVELAANVPMLLLLNTVEQVSRQELAGLIQANPQAVRASFAVIVQLLRTRDPDTVRAGVRRLLSAIDEGALAARATRGGLR